MRKIPTVLQRDFTRDHGRYVTDQITPGCEWVLTEPVTPRRKWDGTAVYFSDWEPPKEAWREGRPYQWIGVRRGVNPGKPLPEGFRTEEYDEVTGKTYGWAPLPFYNSYKDHRRDYGALFEALESVRNSEDHWIQPGSYELVGPTINGNHDRLDHHRLVRHDTAEVADVSRDPVQLMSACADWGWEGVVFYGEDGKLAKLKVRDIRGLT